MKVMLRYFATVRETIGTGSEPVDTQAITVGALRDELLARGGAYAEALARGDARANGADDAAALARDKAVRLALNQNMADESAALTEGAEVGFFPPVTGG